MSLVSQLTVDKPRKLTIESGGEACERTVIRSPLHGQFLEGFEMEMSWIEQWHNTFEGAEVFLIRMNDELVNRNRDITACNRWALVRFVQVFLIEGYTATVCLNFKRWGLPLE